MVRFHMRTKFPKVLRRLGKRDKLRDGDIILHRDGRWCLHGVPFGEGMAIYRPVGMPPRAGKALCKRKQYRTLEDVETLALGDEIRFHSPKTPAPGERARFTDWAALWRGCHMIGDTVSETRNYFPGLQARRSVGSAPPLRAPGQALRKPAKSPAEECAVEHSRRLRPGDTIQAGDKFRHYSLTGPKLFTKWRPVQRGSGWTGETVSTVRETLPGFQARRAERKCA